jgi:CubicO group peptidase (beta-lactamase class C family)
MYNKIILAFCFLVSNLIFAQLNFSEVNRIQNELLTKMDSSVTAGTYEEITSILIAKDGNLIFEKYYNENDVNSKHNTRSATKTMATLLTGIAIKEGFINSEKDKIFKYLQHKLPVKNPDKRKENTTIEDLLTMSSLLECDDNNSFSRGNEERMYLIEDWTQFYLNLPIRAFTFNPKPEELPYGRSFSYCTAGASTMAEVVESAVSMKLDAFAKKYLFDPLEIKDYKLHYTPKRILNTAGGSEYKSRDFLKIIQMCLNKGKWNGKQIISADWIEKASTPKISVFPDMDYGYLFWLTSFGQEKKAKIFAMAGNGGHKILACPELNLSVVITTTNYNNSNAHNYTSEIMDKYIIPAIQKMN